MLGLLFNIVFSSLDAFLLTPLVGPVIVYVLVFLTQEKGRRMEAVVGEKTLMALR